MLGMLANSGKAIHHKQIFQFIGKMAKTYQVVFFRLVRQHNKALAETDSAQRWWAANMDLYID
jgi:L-rhamnose mutarotase